MTMQDTSKKPLGGAAHGVPVKPRPVSCTDCGNEWLGEPIGLCANCESSELEAI